MMDHSTGHLYHNHPHLQDSGTSKGCDLLHRKSPKSRPSSLESAKAMELLGWWEILRSYPTTKMGLRDPHILPRWFILVMDLGASNFRWIQVQVKMIHGRFAHGNILKTLWENRFWSQLTWRVKKNFQVPHPPKLDYPIKKSILPSPVLSVLTGRG